MSEQRNALVIATTLAIASAFFLGGISVLLFPSQPPSPSFAQIFEALSTTSTRHLGWPSNSTVAIILWPLPLDGVLIQNDGTLNVTNAPIRRAGDTYTFTEDIVNKTIVIQRDNIIIDGAGHTLKGFKRGTSGYAYEGIDINERTNVTIKNLVLTQFLQGIWIQNSSDVALTGNTFSDMNTGVSANSARNTKITGNSFTETGGAVTLSNWYGFDNSIENYISGNNITYATTGIAIPFGSSNIVTWNNFVDVLLPVGAGENSTVANNKMLNGIDGVGVASHSSVYQNSILNFTESGLSLSGVNSSIFENNVANSSHAVLMNSGESLILGNNTVYHNNFVNNTESLLLLGNASQSTNFWDNGEEGNYWSSYKGADTNNDGKGDTPFAIEANNVDRYPLMEPYDPQAKSDKSLQAVLFGIGGLAAGIGISVIVFSIVTQKTQPKRKYVEI